MKRFLSIIAMCLTVGALLVGCNEDRPSPEDAKIGILAGLNVGEQDAYKLVRKNNKKLTDYYFVPFDDAKTMLLSLTSGEIDEISVYKSVADYMLARRPAFEVSTAHNFPFNLSDNFCCAVKLEDKELLASINRALKSMKDDGTLERLTKQYITELKDEPEAVAMPSIEGAPTIKVAVTGDMPPLDLIRADGTPAGFNTAVLSEIGRRLNRNVELVSVNSAARASALTSGNVDVIFWVRVPSADDLFPLNFDCPEGVDISEPYFRDSTVHVGIKK